MVIIKRIINWFINLLRKIFKKNKLSKKIKYSINNQSNKHYLKAYGLDNDSISNSLPIYLIVDDNVKEELITKINILSERIENTEDNRKLINKIIKEISKNEISFYQNEIISEKIENIIDDKTIDVDTKGKILNLDKEIMEIIENYDKNIKEKTKKEYDIVNYITLTTLLLDETYIEIKKIEDDIHHHKYNKFYYERELNKIKMRIKNLRKLRENESVRDEIELLKKDLFTKKKDKYDLLYNEEVFDGINKVCDDLLKKVNRRIIDLKKEKKPKIEDDQLKEKRKVKEEENNLKEKRELLESILKRFQDMELARKILLLSQNQDSEIKDKDLLIHINTIYSEFLNGEKFKFNYERNKIKLELIKLCNNIQYINSCREKKDYIPFEHINYSMIELIDYTVIQKEKLDDMLIDKYGYEKDKDETNILVDNKISILRENELDKSEKSRVLVKKNNKEK